MGSSPGFVSTPCHCRPIQTRFRYGSGCHCLNLATESNSLAHSPKGTPSHIALQRPQRGLTSGPHARPRRGSPSPSVTRVAIVLRPLVGIRFQVLFHSPHRGSFHLSLTVLVHYRSPEVFSLGRWSSLLPTGFPVSRGTQGHRRKCDRFRLRDCHPLWFPFPVGFG